MTNRKSNNSILFLTTLGVYLGLVLAGATPVLGHAATSRSFDIRDEVELRDDLDNKPDSETALEIYSAAFESIFITACELADTFPDLIEQRRYDFDMYYGINAAGRLNGISYLGKGVVSGKYTSPIRSLYNAFPHTAEPDSNPFRLVFAVEPDSFEFEVAFAQHHSQHAEQLAEAYAALLPTLKERQVSAARRLIYESTQISSRENQVYIITRLPRAALGPLLATRAK